MGRSRRGRSALLILVATTAALVMLLVAPVFGSGDEPAVRLHMGTDFQSFDDGTTSQPIQEASSGCVLSASSVSGPLVTLSANPGGKVGTFDLSIGVKTGGSNGTPCSLVDDSELLVIESAPGRPDWRALRLDLETKGNAWVVVDLFDGAEPVGSFTLLTGSSIEEYNLTHDPDETSAPGFPYTALTTASDPVAACASPSDSGPDSGPNDNCLWTIQPDGAFDRVAITTQVGYASLEGSEDFGNDPAHDTIFFYNQDPEPSDDAYTVDEDTTLSVDAADGLLANDDDPESDPFEVISNTDPANGVVTVAADGSFTYTPDANFFGEDGFQYTVADDLGAQATALVSIAVNPVNDAPLALGADGQGDEDTQLVFTVDALGFDVEDDPLQLVITSPPTNGTTEIDPLTGAIVYTPDPDFYGSDSFDYEVCEQATGLCSPQTATVNIGVIAVNDAPVALDDSYEFDENSGANVVGAGDGVLGNDSDVEGDPFTAILDDPPQHGSLLLSSDGSFTYTPDEGFFGADGFTYHADDGTDAGSPAQVDITVVEVICSEETVSDTDGTVTGSFTLISPTFQCKRYSVTAHEASRTVDFELGEGVTLPFRGFLVFGGQSSPGGVNSLQLEYDPDGSGPESYRVMQLCIGPAFDGDGNVLAPGSSDPSILPSGETWCLAAMSSTADQDGLFLNVYQVYGESDPGFRIG